MTSSGSRPRLLVVIGATRPGRLAPRVAAWFLSAVADHPGFDIELADLADVGLPLLDEPGNPARGDGYEHEHTRSWSRTVDAADAFVFVMPEYNNGYTAAIKNAIDYLFMEWRDKAVGFVSYGGNLGGGTRAVQALKPVLLAVGATPIHQAVNIPFVYTMLDDYGGFRSTPVLDQAAVQVLDELARRDRGLRVLRSAGSVETEPRPTHDEGLVS